MASKNLPFNKKLIDKLISKYPTPFHIYDENRIRESARGLKKAFSWAPGFINYFAVKATPNPFILKILKEEGFGADCSSMAELILADKTGITGEKIMFTSNDTPAEEFVKARELGAIINLDDITHLRFLEEHAGIPDLICFRYNPGSIIGGNAIIGKPEEAKYGLTKEQIFDGYKVAKDMGIKRFGIHTMLASNELNWEYFVETANILFDLIVEISNKLGIRFEFANLGGGIGIPYKPEQETADLKLIGDGIRNAYKKKIATNGLAPLKIFMENGRLITGPNGFLVSTVIHKKETYRNYIGLDASMSDLMRPGMYGAYHHITVLGKEKMPLTKIYDVTGSLCENNDKFAIQRKLPEIEVDDIIVIHDTGAHGHAMGFQYNGMLRSAELLLRPDGEIIQIRRAETIGDYFATLDFEGLKDFI